MSRISKLSKQISNSNADAVVNHMGGVSYSMNPLDTLEIMASSSILAEPKYYRQDGSLSSSKPYVPSSFSSYSIFCDDHKSEFDSMKDAVKKSLDYDFGGTIDLALKLRTEYMMRLNPQLIMVMASMHENRRRYDEENPGKFRKVNVGVMKRADEPAEQFACYLVLNGGSKSKIPSVLKRSWKDRIETMTAYEVNKYKNGGAGIINTVRMCHAGGKLIGDLMKNGSVDVDSSEETWERLKSGGHTFKEIRNSTRIPHMALLRNLRGILSECEVKNDREYANGVFSDLLNGVKGGKQFPFRYFCAAEEIRKESNRLPFASNAIDCLNQCVETSIDMMPKIEGRTMCLSDNSGSAWGQLTSEYGTVTVANIDNLSSVIISKLSDEGYVGKFGDKLIVFPVSKNDGSVGQAMKISEDRDGDVGGSTENGIWEFFRNAIRRKEWWDNVFVFSDQQAGHGGLYGKGVPYVIGSTDFTVGSHYIDVLKLVKEYRAAVNPKMNFFTIQTAGYSNAVIPQHIYRGAVMSGWTGKEAVFAKQMIDKWNEIDSRNGR